MPGQIAHAAHGAPERAAARGLGGHRGDCQRLPAPHDAQHRGPADCRRQGRRAAVLGARSARGARSHPQCRHRPGRGALSAVGTLSGRVRPAGGAPVRGAPARSAMIADLDLTARAGLPMTWFDKIMPSRIKTERRTRSVPEGLWIKCPACDAVLYRAELERNLYVCPKCSHHMRMGARDRLERFLDPGTTAEIGAAISPEDPLKFRDSKRYRERLAQAQKATGESDALVVLAGTLHALPIVACAFEFQFLGGSMGSVVGERFKRGVDYCIQERRPFVCFSASGGARMQEALYSLFQMAKTAAALSRLAQAHLPFISVLTDPTTGGVSASLALLGDLNLAEPRALIGFAGPRVIQQTVRETLPERARRSPQPQVRCARSPSGSRCRSRCIRRASTWSSRASPRSRAPSGSPSRHLRW